MSAPEKLIDFDFNFEELNTLSAPILAEPSAAGEATIVLDKDWTGDITKAVVLAAKTPSGKFMQLYIEAGGWVDAQNATIKTRPLKQNTSDIEDADTDNDFDLPANTKIYPVVSNYNFKYLTQALLGQISCGGNFLYIGDETDQNYTFGFFNATSGKRGLVRYNDATGKAQYTNDGVAWIDFDSAAPANITTRSTTTATANNGEIFRDSGDNFNLKYKDSGGTIITLYDETAEIIPLESIQRYSGVDVGGDDDFVIAPSPSINSLVTGMRFTVKATAGNTGACTLDVGDGSGPISIVMPSGADPTTQYITNGSIFEVVFNGTYFQLVSTFATAEEAHAFFLGTGMTASQANELISGLTTALHQHGTGVVNLAVQSKVDNVASASGTEVFDFAVGDSDAIKVKLQYALLIGHGSAGGHDKNWETGVIEYDLINDTASVWYDTRASSGVGASTNDLLNIFTLDQGVFGQDFGNGLMAQKSSLPNRTGSGSAKVQIVSIEKSANNIRVTVDWQTTSNVNGPYTEFKISGTAY